MCTARPDHKCRLSPHEADDLDIILLGHSLGGILAAEVALFPAPLHSHEFRKHKILGLINFDVPFLGLHPGIIQTSCKTLFQREKNPAPMNENFSASQMTAEAIAAFSPSHYDPPFFNDSRSAERGGMQGIMHFLDKNYDRLSRSILNRIVSPVEFTSCLNNYPELRRRYKQLMDLEASHDQPHGIRFVNYYTSSECLVTSKDNNAAGNENPSPSVDGKESTPCNQSENEPEPGPGPEAEPKTEAEAETEPCSLTPTKSQQESESQCEPDQPDCTCPPETADCTSKEHKKKRRRFILLPSNHWSRGDDSLWVPVTMENMNEILAHQSMFLPHGRNYEQLVGDTMATIEQWVQADLTQRVLAQCEPDK